MKEVCESGSRNLGGFGLWLKSEGMLISAELSGGPFLNLFSSSYVKTGAGSWDPPSKIFDDCLSEGWGIFGSCDGACSSPPYKAFVRPRGLGDLDWGTRIVGGSWIVRISSEFSR